jgi:hypothetical protein
LTLRRNSVVIREAPGSLILASKAPYEAARAWRMTTFTSYGAVGARRQAEIIRDLATPATDRSSGVEELAEAVVRRLRQPGATNTAAPDGPR